MKYSPEMTLEITKRLEIGLLRTDSCQLAGIHYDTFCEWMKKPEFSDAVKKAEIKCKERLCAIIQKAAITTWQAAAWWLERKLSSEFALKTKTELSDPNGRAIPYSITVVPMDINGNGHAKTV